MSVHKIPVLKLPFYLALLLLPFAASLYAPTNETIHGTVADPVGKLVLYATVVIQHGDKTV